MKKGINDKLILIPAAIFAVYGLIVLGILGFSHWFNFASLIVALLFVLLYVFRKAIKRLNKTIKILFCVIILAALFCFSSFEFRAIGCALNAAPAEDAEWIMVLGAKVNGSSPSLEFARRLDAAADYAKACDVKIMLTGGKGSDEGLSEAECARNYLISKGISSERIYYENRSTSTSENFRFAKDAGGADFENKGIIVVSSAFHLYRAGIIAAEEGYTNISYIGSTGKIILLPQYFAREYAAYVREFRRII